MRMNVRFLACIACALATLCVGGVVPDPLPAIETAFVGQLEQALAGLDLVRLGHGAHKGWALT